MDVMEKLIKICFREFCDIAIDSPCGCDGCPYGEYEPDNGDCYVEYKKDKIEKLENDMDKYQKEDNGVTVHEWIPVYDRLPDVVSTHKVYRSTIKKSTRVLCVCVQKSGKTMVKEGYCEWYNDYPEPRWKIPGTIDKVTHWQYLPQPPKGE